MGNCRRDDVTTPAVLYRHGDVQGYAQVPDLAGFSQSSDLGDLQVDDVHCAVGVAAKQCIDTRDVFVQYEGQGRALPDRQAVLIGSAGLLDVYVPIAHRVDDSCCVVNAPTRIGVRHEDFSVRQDIRNGMNTVDVVGRSAADLELEPGVAVRTMRGDVVCHFITGSLTDGAVQGDTVAELAAHQVADGPAGDLSENVPACHVDGGLDVRVAQQSLVHKPVDRTDRTRILTQERRRQLPDPDPRAGPESRQVERAQGTDFTETRQAVVGK